MKEALKLLGMAMGPACMGAVGIVFLKRASAFLGNALSSWDALAMSWSRIALAWELWLGVGLYAAAFAWLMLVLPHVRVSQFFPLAVSLNIIMTVAVGIIFLNEPISSSRLVGLALIIAGVSIVSR